ncbi:MULTISPECIES: hypothetical protein [Actinomycetes]|uniref:hypothetical protein n=1 Tax=Actinomycetes TaxID=1760 RepID=UPI0004C26FF4|nr:MULTISPECIES: hypothetical protein [Actinomycetes]
MTRATDWRVQHFTPAFNEGFKNIHADRGDVVAVDCIGFLAQRRPQLDRVDQHRLIAAELHNGEIVHADKGDTIGTREFVGTAHPDSDQYNDVIEQAQEIADDWTRRQARTSA